MPLKLYIITLSASCLIELLIAALSLLLLLFLCHFYHHLVAHHNLLIHDDSSVSTSVNIVALLFTIPLLLSSWLHPHLDNYIHCSLPFFSSCSLDIKFKTFHLSLLQSCFTCMCKTNLSCIDFSSHFRCFASYSSCDKDYTRLMWIRDAQAMIPWTNQAMQYAIFHKYWLLFMLLSSNFNF